MPQYALVLKNKPFIIGSQYAPPDVWGSNSKSGQTGQKTVDVARSLGIEWEMVPNVSFQTRIETARGIVPKCWFSEEAREGFNALKEWRQRKNEALSTPDKPVYFEEPVKDWTRHVGDAFSHAALVYRELSIQGERVGASKQTMPVTQHKPYHSKPGQGLKALA